MLTNNERQARFQIKARLNKKIEEELNPMLWPIYKLTNGYTAEDVERVNEVLKDFKYYPLGKSFNKSALDEYAGVATLLIFEHKYKIENLILELIYLAAKYKYLKIKPYFAFLFSGYVLDKKNSKKLFNNLLFNNNLSVESLDCLKDLIDLQMNG